MDYKIEVIPPPRGAGQRGAPSKYTPEMAEEITRRMVNGETLTSICTDSHMPERHTVLNWVWDNVDGFASAYHKARQLQAEGLIDETLDIADDSRNDFIMRETKRGYLPVYDREHVQRSALRIQARQFAVTKGHPKLYIVPPLPPSDPEPAPTLAHDPQTAAREYAQMMRDMDKE